MEETIDLDADGNPVPRPSANEQKAMHPFLVFLILAPFVLAMSYFQDQWTPWAMSFPSWVASISDSIWHWLWGWSWIEVGLVLNLLLTWRVNSKLTNLIDDGSIGMWPRWPTFPPGE